MADEKKNIEQIMTTLDQGKKEKIYTGALTLMSGILSNKVTGLAKVKLYQNFALECAYELLMKCQLVKENDEYSPEEIPEELDETTS